MKYGFLFSVSSVMQENAGRPVTAGARVAAGRDVGRGRWQPDRATVSSPPSKDRVGSRATRTRNTESCFCRDSRRTIDFHATAIRGLDTRLEPVRRKFHWRQIPAAPALQPCLLGHAPPDNQCRTCSTPMNREEEPVSRNAIPGKHGQSLPGISINLDTMLVRCEMLPADSNEVEKRRKFPQCT